MQIKQLTKALERLAPPSLQESYDNSGLLIGQEDSSIESALICLDCTEDVVSEAIKLKAGLIIAHHPIIFSGLKRFNGANYVQRTVELAIRNNIAVYAIHTNLDNVRSGVNAMIAKKLGLSNTSILQAIKGKLLKLVVFCPEDQAEEVRNAMWTAGAGQIGAYDQCSFNSQGNGTFRPNESANPYVGKVAELHSEKEQRIEMILPDWVLKDVVSAMKDAHPYEEVAYDLYRLENENSQIGAGMLGELEIEMNGQDFLKHLKSSMNAAMVRHTRIPDGPLKRIAICGGSGSFLLSNAIRAKADVFVTADFKYHQFFDAEDKIMIADIGHFETEQFTVELLGDELRQIFPKFALHFTSVNTNPINYF